MMVPRLMLGLLAAALVIAIGGPFRWIALRRGSRTGEGLSVLFHRLLCAALGVRVRIHGQVAPTRPQLVVSNHVSWLDIPILGSMRPTEFLAKKEVGGAKPGARDVESAGRRFRRSQPAPLHTRGQCGNRAAHARRRGGHFVR